jgi:hypothetical protein
MECNDAEHGDYTVCLRCGLLLRFMSRLRLMRIPKAHLREMTPETIKELQKHAPSR